MSAHGETVWESRWDMCSAGVCFLLSYLFPSSLFLSFFLSLSLFLSPSSLSSSSLLPSDITIRDCKTKQKAKRKPPPPSTSTWGPRTTYHWGRRPLNTSVPSLMNSFIVLALITSLLFLIFVLKSCFLVSYFEWLMFLLFLFCLFCLWWCRGRRDVHTSNWERDGEYGSDTRGITKT